MTAIRGALANPTGWFPGNLPGSSRAVPGLVVVLLAVGLAAQGVLTTPSLAQDSTVGETESEDINFFEQDEVKTQRDSLRVEILRYSEMAKNLRDSLEAEGKGIRLNERQREIIEENIDEVTQMIEAVGKQLSRLEFEVSNNTISLVNELGEGVVITIPENLDDELSEGFQILSQVILSELPDSIDFDRTQSWDWSEFIPEAPAPPRKVMRGNLIKVGDDLHVTAKDDVRGHVVVIFGDAEVSGRVDGNVVVVFGNLLVDETCEITGKAVAVGGRLDQDSDAEVGGVVAIDPLRGFDGGGLFGLMGGGLVAFLVSQGGFLLTVLLAVVVIVAAPRARFEAITGTLSGSVGPSFGVGLAAAMVGHLMAVVLMAVLVLTVIGVPLALLVFLALVVAAILAIAVSGAVLGQWVCRRLGSSCRSPWMTVVVGLAALHVFSFLGSVLGLLPTASEAVASVLGVLGLVAKSLAYLLGLGALLLSRFGARTLAASD
jgi:hypothetical protein